MSNIMIPIRDSFTQESLDSEKEFQTTVTTNETVKARQGKQKQGCAGTAELLESMESLQQKVDGLEAVLIAIQDRIVCHQTEKESYTTAEVAKILGKRPYTVREWCRGGRVHAYKVNGPQSDDKWRLTHSELLRIQNFGLLPRTE